MTHEDRLDQLGLRAAAFVEQADLRTDGTGDFDAYHSARHDLVMALEELADSRRAKVGPRTAPDVVDIVVTVGVDNAATVEEMILANLRLDEVSARVWSQDSLPRFSGDCPRCAGSEQPNRCWLCNPPDSNSGDSGGESDTRSDRLGPAGVRVTALVWLIAALATYR